MKNPRFGVLVTTFNDPEILSKNLGSLYDQHYDELNIVCVDDASKIPASETIDFDYDTERLEFIRIPHSERAVARGIGIKRLMELDVDYFIFLDSDMHVTKGFFGKINRFIREEDPDGIIFPEQAYSKSTNFSTRVKVFERNLYQAHYDNYTPSSIEAARMWKTTSFRGFIDGLNAFEEIQPTIRAYKENQVIKKIKGAFIHHDEGYVTIKNLLKKKRYYFNDASSHEEVKLGEMISRFYFFRGQLYNMENLVKYLKHPVLTLGVIYMYFRLSLIGVSSVIKNRKGR